MHFLQLIVFAFFITFSVSRYFRDFTKLKLFIFEKVFLMLYNFHKIAQKIIKPALRA